MNSLLFTGIGSSFIAVSTDPKIHGIYRDPRVPEHELVGTAKDLVGGIFAAVAQMVQKQHSGAYLANVFKNAQKNKDLETMLDADSSGQVGENLELNFGS